MFRYVIMEKDYKLPIVLNKGDVVNLKEVLGIETIKEAYRVNEAIWRRDDIGMYCEVWFDEM